MGDFSALFAAVFRDWAVILCYFTCKVLWGDGGLKLAAVVAYDNLSGLRCGELVGKLCGQST
jgi:hypothetical protein